MARIAALEAAFETNGDEKAGEVMPGIQGQRAAAPGSKAQESLAAVSGLAIEKYGAITGKNTYPLDFTITNKNPGTLVSGFLVAVLVPRDLHGSFLSVPAMAVVDGVPEAPEKG